MTDPTVIASTTSTTTAAMSVKYPPFWTKDPEAWFAQVEAQFVTRGVMAQKTKFDYVISSLSPEFATEIHDLLIKLPEENPYSTFKTHLIKRTATSKQRKLQQLISRKELGDRKLTQLLRQMQQSLGDHGTTTDNSFLREFFLQCLPSNVRMVLASADSITTLETLADMADMIMEVSTPTVATVSAPPFTDFSQLWKQSVLTCRSYDFLSTRESLPSSLQFL